VLLRLEAEGVYVDTGGRHVGVVLVGLDKIEVTALTLRETVVAIELKLGGVSAVFARVKEGYTETADPRIKNVVELRATRSKCLTRLIETRSAHATVVITIATLVARAIVTRGAGLVSTLAEERKSTRVPRSRSVGTTHTAAKRVGRSAGVVRLVDRVSEVEPLRTASGLALDILMGLNVAHVICG